jgi:GNAT superfamily N-acetyltransferase
MPGFQVRSLRSDDQALWRQLWDGYNAFYGRSGTKALPEEVHETLWRRLNDPTEPVIALVAESEGRLYGLAQLIFHRSTSSTRNVCYLQDLFVASDARRRGMGRELVLASCRMAEQAGCGRIYWHTQGINRVARRLYDQVARRTGFIVYRQEL